MVICFYLVFDTNIEINKPWYRKLYNRQHLQKQRSTAFISSAVCSSLRDSQLLFYVLRIWMLFKMQKNTHIVYINVRSYTSHRAPIFTVYCCYLVLDDVHRIVQPCFLTYKCEGRETLWIIL